MGTLEIRARNQRRLRHLQYAVLSAVGVAGVLAWMMIAPNTFQAIPALMGKKKYDAKFGYRARTVAGRLAQRGLVRFVERGGKKHVEITDAGKDMLLREQFKSAQMNGARKRRWDKRYRMVIFDIPERRKSIRANLRRAMQDFGFLLLQDSVWIFPYDCEDVIALIKADLQVGKDVLYVIAEAIENDTWIRKHFQLPLD